MKPPVVLLLCALAVTDAGAQTVRGRLVDGLSRAAVSGALVELRDAQNVVVTQAFTTSSGAFAFAVTPAQPYQLRIAAIGYARHAPVAFTAAAEPMALPEIVLAPVVVTLPELRAMGGQRACGKSELNPETFGGLLESARTSLQVMDATLRSGQLGFEMRRINRISVKQSRDSSISADTTSGVLHEWPVSTLSPDSLQKVGFARTKTYAEGGGHQWYGPDMQVMFSDWFLDSHCFTIDKKLSVGDTVVIRFDPAGKAKRVDVSGNLVLDRSSLTLRRFTYAFRNPPDGVPDRSAGGDMFFAELSPGLWVPTDWAIWAPLTKVQRMISRPTPVVISGRAGRTAVTMGRTPPEEPLVQVVGRKEQRGHVTRVVPAGG